MLYGMNPLAIPQKTDLLLRELNLFTWIGEVTISWGNICSVLFIYSNTYKQKKITTWMPWIQFNILLFRFLDPIIFGKYPQEMKDILGSLLPPFSKDYFKKLKNGLDFIGVNHYTSFFVKDCLHSTCEQGPGISKTEGYYLRTALKNNALIGESVRNS